MSVPRRYVLVWMGRDFPYVCRLAVESIALADPGAAIEVHLFGERPDDDRLAPLGRLSAVTLHDTTEAEVVAASPQPGALQRLLDAIPRQAHSARSNVLRYALLYARGGVYVDFDVLVLRPLHELAGGDAFVGAERVWSSDERRVERGWSMRMWPSTAAWGCAWMARRADCRILGGRARASDRLARLSDLWSAVQVNNAVIGAPAGAELLRLLLEAAATASPTVRYALGPTLVSKVAAQHPDTVTVLPERVLYCVPPGESFRFFEDRTLELPRDAAVVHYVNSNHRELLAGIQEGDPRFRRREVFWRLAAAVERRREELAPGALAAT